MHPDGSKPTEEPVTAFLFFNNICGMITGIAPFSDFLTGYSPVGKERHSSTREGDNKQAYIGKNST
jgi:hypothetical protein